MQKRGQASTELVLTVGFALLMIIPLAVILYEHGTTTFGEVNNNQAGLIARKVTDTANDVYYLGYPSIVTLKMYFPEHLSAVNITQREIYFTFEDGKVVTSTANANLTGTLRTSSGLRYIKIAAFENYVNISDENT